jgi:hypothetical protein
LPRAPERCAPTGRGRCCAATAGTGVPVCKAAPVTIDALREGGRSVDDEGLAHIWPTHHENTPFYGTHSVDIDGEPAQLDADGYKPLPPAALSVG